MTNDRNYLLVLNQEEKDLLNYSLMITKQYLTKYLPDDKYERVELIENKLSKLPIQPPSSSVIGKQPDIMMGQPHIFNGET